MNKTAVAMAVMAVSYSCLGFADEAEGPALDNILIIGSPEEAKLTAGSAHVITELELEKLEYTDINAALRQVPGVYLRMEEGYGLRPNIGIRSAASGPERSNKITIMEDGVPVQPAPYAASAAYYSPTFGRISGLEVLKGPSAITVGPHTVGGAINYLSTPIPEEQSGRVNVELGSDDHIRTHVNYGDTQEQFAYLLESYQHRASGFKDIDFSDNTTGFVKQDWMLKLRFNSASNSNHYQQLDIKLLNADEVSDQSYLGLTDSHFSADPNRRYLASEEDRMDVEHLQFSLNYSIVLQPGLELSAQLYEHQTKRNWFKLNKINGSGISSFINTANADDENAQDAQSVLNGWQEAALQYKNNNREYFARGLQLHLNYDFSSGAVDHDFQIGLRFHKDEEDRFQKVDDYWQNISGGINFVATDGWGVGSNNNRLTEARAVAFHIYDKISWGDWTFTPGLRHEDVTVERQRWNGPDRIDSDLKLSKSGRNDQSEWMPGLGVTYGPSDGLLLLAGIHKGFSPAGYDEKTDPEQSYNWEYGFRYGKDHLYGELIGFFSNYDNILGECTNVGGGNCTDENLGDQENGGEAEVTGLEAIISYTFNPEGSIKVPVVFSYTLMDTKYNTSFDSDLFGIVSEGDSLLYTPQNQWYASVGLENDKWSAYLAASFVDETCTKASCMGKTEKTDEILNLDFSVSRQLNDSTEVYVKLENLSNEADIISRHPAGARVQKPRTFMAGLRLDF